MENTKGYRKLFAWQKADQLAFQVYIATRSFPREEIFCLTSQMRRAALSVPANIVEGYARSSNKEKIQFYTISRGSLAELEYFIDFSSRLKYISDSQHAILAGLRNETGRLLTGLIMSLKKPI